MIPILYESTETAFNTNGLGRLRDCVECVVTEERNGIYECDFTYPITGQNYDLIKLGRIIAAECDDTGNVQPFDIVSCSRGIDGTVDFHCVHISYRLSKHVATGKNINSLSAAFSLFKGGWPSVPFSFSTDKSSSGYMACADNTPRTIREMMGGIEGSVLDTYGGEYKFDKFNVALLDHRGKERDLIIRYGVDMVDYSEDVDCSETYSAVLPYWSGNEQIVISNNVVRSGSLPPSGREECIPLDLSDKFENAPTKAQLATEAAAYLGKANPTLPAQTITVDFVRLSDSPEYEQYKGLYECQLCDTIKVVFPKYDMSGRFKIVKTTYDVLLERYTELELGTLSTTLSDALGVSNGLGGGQLSENLADYVVEQGTSGNWTYRKWHSGIAECWETWTSAAFAPATAVGGFYGRVLPSSGTYSLPSGLFVTAPIMSINLTEWGSGYFWGSARAVTSTSFKMTLFRNDNASSAGVAKIYAIGAWK